MSPLNIQVMLWVYASPARVQEHMPEISPDALEACEADLRDAGLVEECSTFKSGLRATKKGEVYVEALCNMPMPVERWAMP